MQELSHKFQLIQRLEPYEIKKFQKNLKIRRLIPSILSMLIQKQHSKLLALSKFFYFFTKVQIFCLESPAKTNSCLKPVLASFEHRYLHMLQNFKPFSTTSTIQVGRNQVAEKFQNLTIFCNHYFEYLLQFENCL